MICEIPFNKTIRDITTQTDADVEHHERFLDPRDLEKGPQKFRKLWYNTPSRRKRQNQNIDVTYVVQAKSPCLMMIVAESHLHI